MKARIVDLDTACNEIKQACDEAASGRPPFFFLTGAGVSAPSIPLSAEIVTDCQAKAKSLGRSVGSPKPTPSPSRSPRSIDSSRMRTKAEWPQAPSS
jgi:hypothetical protein